MNKWESVAVLAVLIAACGRDSEQKKPPATSKAVAGFEFEISIEPSTFVPAEAKAVRIASDGNAQTNPPDTVQLFTPNDTLTWQSLDDGDVFGFDVQLTNFYAHQLCALVVVVDSITPAKGRTFLEDDRGAPYAAAVTGQGLWAYGVLGAKEMHGRRWMIKLHDKERFTLKGRVLADDGACGTQGKIP